MTPHKRVHAHLRRAIAVCVDPLQVRRLWPHVAPLIERAMARGGLSDFTAVAADVLEGTALLWLAWDGAEILGAAVTQLGIEPDGRKVCTIVACASAQSRPDSPRHARSLMPVSGRPVRVDADLRDEHGLQLRHGGTPSPQRGEGAGRTRGSPVHAFARWGFLIAELEQFAREEGCVAMRINGRRGWARVLNSMKTGVNALSPDYRTKAVILEKELT